MNRPCKCRSDDTQISVSHSYAHHPPIILPLIVHSANMQRTACDGRQQPFRAPETKATGMSQQDIPPTFQIHKNSVSLKSRVTGVKAAKSCRLPWRQTAPNRAMIADSGRQF